MLNKLLVITAIALVSWARVDQTMNYDYLTEVQAFKQYSLYYLGAVVCVLLSLGVRDE